MFKKIIQTAIYVYDKKYKQLFLIPLLLLILSLVVLGNHYVKTGEFISLGVSLKGGTTLSIAKPVDINEMTSFLSVKFPNSDIGLRSLSIGGKEAGVVIEASDVDADLLFKTVEEKTGVLDKSEYTIDTTGSSLGKSFFKQAMFALILAFISISIVVYLYFRSAIPSFYAVFCVAADMLFAMAIFVLAEYKLTTASIAAFLLLIGYSIDTDILLTTRVLKRKEGSVSERMASTILTGLTMTSTAIIAIVVGYFSTDSELLKQITFILGWGLFADIIFTWLFNAALLRIYVEKVEAKHEP